MIFVNYLVESYQSFALTRNKNLTFYSEPDTFVMDFDPEKLQRIIENLISNALKYTPEYGRIKVIFKADKDNFTMEVSDNGIGIEPKDLPLIFDRFYQSGLSSNDNDSGTGIGLALVKDLVEWMKGEIKVESTLGKGTSFHVSLPVNRIASLREVKTPIFAELNQTDKVHSGSGFALEPSPRLNILTTKEHPFLLIIEDNLDVIDYLKICLTNCYNITVARNGEEGIRQAFEQIPDIIITDVMMPVMNGYQVCEHLKGDERTSHIPIIILTAKASKEDRLIGLSKGADAYLTKPFNQKELLVRLEKLIELRKNLQVSVKHGHLRVKSENVFLQKLDRAVFDHLDDEFFDVTRLCRAMAMSRTQLHRKITALTDMSTAQYIKYTRLREAQHLLKNSDLNVSEVAYKVGFKHPNNFSTAYKGHFGILPNETRK